MEESAILIKKRDGSRIGPSAFVIRKKGCVTARFSLIWRVESEKEQEMLTDLLKSKELLLELLRIDRQVAEEAQRAGCPCGGKLHRADYPRKPRGCELGELAEQYSCRYSFCCERDGCRKRVTPPSVRFLDRRVYLGAVLILACSEWLLSEHSPQGIEKRAVKRWLRFWQGAFLLAPMWCARGAVVMPPVGRQSLPASLLVRFKGSIEEMLVGMLRFIVPLQSPY